MVSAIVCAIAWADGEFDGRSPKRPITLHYAGRWLRPGPRDCRDAECAERCIAVRRWIRESRSRVPGWSCWRRCREIPLDSERGDAERSGLRYSIRDQSEPRWENRRIKVQKISSWYHCEKCVMSRNCELGLATRYALGHRAATMTCVNRATFHRRLNAESFMTRILGLDFGTRRVGIAISDPGRTMAFPVEVYEPRGAEPDARHYRELARENEIERIVVGLPLHTSGREGELALRARKFGEWLASVTGCPVVYYDERYSTVEAEQSLLAAGLDAEEAQIAARQACRADHAARLSGRRMSRRPRPAPTAAVRSGWQPIVTTLIIGCGYLGQRAGALLSRAWRTRVMAPFVPGLEPPRSPAWVSSRSSPTCWIRTSLRGLPAAERVFYCVGFDRSAGASMRTVYVDGLKNVLDHLSREVTRIVVRELDRSLRPDRRRVGRRRDPAQPAHESGKVCLEAEERLRDWADESGTAESAV